MKRSMSQRTASGLVALLVGMVLLAFPLLDPLSYVVYRPGVTVDVLGVEEGERLVQVTGSGQEPTYSDDGQLRMVTVSVTSPDTTMRLPELLAGWSDRTNAVYPWSSVYTSGDTNSAAKAEGAAQMASSQDNATAVALRESGIEVPEVTRIGSVVDGEPADGKLKAGDIVLAIDGVKPDTADAMVAQIRATPQGQALRFKVKRDGKPLTVSVTPVERDGVPRIGAAVGVGYDFPVSVKVNLNPAIGGPSAGLIFSLAIYDTLTDGNLTGGHVIAGTGSINPDGTVGAIGGIQQKIAGATRDGAALFLVPSDNCAEALGAPDARDGRIRLVRATTMHDARESIESWVKDPDATLPTCKADQS